MSVPVSALPVSTPPSVLLVAVRVEVHGGLVLVISGIVRVLVGIVVVFVLLKLHHFTNLKKTRRKSQYVLVFTSVFTHVSSKHLLSEHVYKRDNSIMAQVERSVLYWT